MKGEQWLHLPGHSLSWNPHTAWQGIDLMKDLLDENIHSFINETKATNFSVEPQFQDEAVKAVVQTKGKEMHSSFNSWYC